MLKNMLKATVFATTMALATGAFYTPAFAEVVYNRGSAAEPESVDPHKTSTVYEANILRDLFQSFVAEPLQLPPHYHERVEREGPHRVVCDYIAGMTDRFALDEHRKLFDPAVRV